MVTIINNNSLHHQHECIFCYYLMIRYTALKIHHSEDFQNACLGTSIWNVFEKAHTYKWKTFTILERNVLSAAEKNCANGTSVGNPQPRDWMSDIHIVAPRRVWQI